MPHADSFAVGITSACVIIFLLITLVATGYHFIHKHNAVKKDIPVLSDHIASS